ncbi:FMN-binding protein [Acidaminobacter sp. JC074]|uniref:FMN-binding protein n=1 Tax=Acidaminobacter sp. JC074 TaxID=2530199 RepID=UPI001F1152B7|nr:FMN-binding protein [Acidaminobacter sp. JC074]
MNRQLIRTVVQALCLVLTLLGFFVNFAWTMGIIMLAIIIGGTFYCGWICPFGTLQEFSNKLARLLNIKQKKMPKAFHRIFKYTRYIVFAVVGLSTLPIIMDIMSYEPRTAFLSLLSGNVPAVLALGVIVLFTLLSMVYERFYCNYLCYEGAKYGLIGLFRPVTIHRNIESCIDCGKCDKSCSMNIEVSQFEVLRSPNCINCFKCLDACPVDNTLEYGFKPKKLFTKSYRLLLISLLIVIPAAIMVLAGTDDHHEAEATTSNSDYTNVEISGMPSEHYADGTYEGVGGGFKGNIYVEVVVESGLIKNVTVTDHNDDRKWYNMAESIIGDIIGTQSTNVDLVSGATYSSSGIRDAVINALENAVTEETNTNSSNHLETAPAGETTVDVISDIPSGTYTDGTYEGVGRGFKGNIYVEVVVESGLIKNVTVTDHNDDRKWYNRAEGIIDDILHAQSTDVDLVSGATYSSSGIRDAVINALEKAN